MIKKVALMVVVIATVLVGAGIFSCTNDDVISTNYQEYSSNYSKNIASAKHSSSIRLMKKLIY